MILCKVEALKPKCTYFSHAISLQQAMPSDGLPFMHNRLRKRRGPTHLNDTMIKCQIWEIELLVITQHQ